MAKWVDWIDGHLESVLLRQWQTLDAWSEQQTKRGHAPSFENWLRMELAGSMQRGSAVAIRTDGRLLKKKPNGQGADGKPLPVRQFSSKQAADHVGAKAKSFQSPDISVQVLVEGTSFVIDVEIKTQFGTAGIVGDLEYVKFHNATQAGTNYRACFVWCFVNPASARSDFAAAEAVKKTANKRGLNLDYRCLDATPWIAYAISAPGA